MLTNDIKKYIGEISGASARHFANATRADESGDDVLAARLRVEAHVLLAVAVKLDQILSVNEPEEVLPPQLNKHDVVRSAALRIVSQLLKEGQSILKDLDISNDDKCTVLNYLGWSCEDFRTH